MTEDHSDQGIPFEWDPEKAASNLAKHGVSFETAREAFFDPFVVAKGSEVVDHELRESLIGMTRRWQMLCVVYVVRVGGTYRIISAREADPNERREYEDQ
jgi:uncharacterized DUF497 family protein